MHRHGYQGRKFGRLAGPRRALLRGLATSLVLHEAITTTEAKAKELKLVMDRLIIQAKKGTLSDRRRVAAFLQEEAAVQKIFSETAPFYADRTSGFTRLAKLGPRKGDASRMVRIELIDYKPLATKRAAKARSEAAVSETVEEASAAEKPKRTRKKAAPKAEVAS